MEVFDAKFFNFHACSELFKHPVFLILDGRL